MSDNYWKPTSKPSTKRLTILGLKNSPDEIWDVSSFYCKKTKDISGRKSDTKKVRVKIRDKKWNEANIPNINAQGLWGVDVVVTHKKLNYDVYSGHIDDVEEKKKSRILDLHVTEVSDRIN